MKTNRKSLKPKDVEILNVLQCKHPGDLSEADRVLLDKLQKLRAKYGDKHGNV